MRKFNCSKCDQKVVDTNHKVVDELHLALSPWLSMCTDCEKKHFDNLKLESVRILTTNQYSFTDRNNREVKLI